jgi:TonB family protein
MVNQLLTFLILIALSSAISAQMSVVPRSAEWIRIQSDNGEFSVEVPRNSVFYASQNGFLISEGGFNNDNHLKDMKMLSSFSERTLINLETYLAPKSALDAIYSIDTSYVKSFENLGANFKESVVDKPTYRLKQTLKRKTEATMIRQYFASKNRIYILTAASRDGITPEMSRFFDSVKVNDNKAVLPAPDVPVFSNLPITEPKIEMQLLSDDDWKSRNKAPAPPAAEADNGIKKPVILLQSKAAYIASARRNNTRGTVRLKLTLSPGGYISKIVVQRTRPDGLLRQALFAALRIKFLPREKNGIAETAEITREYAFMVD